MKTNQRKTKTFSGLRSAAAAGRSTLGGLASAGSASEALSLVDTLPWGAATDGSCAGDSLQMSDGCDEPAATGAGLMATAAGVGLMPACGGAEAMSCFCFSKRGARGGGCSGVMNKRELNPARSRKAAAVATALAWAQGAIGVVCASLSSATHSPGR